MIRVPTLIFAAACLLLAIAAPQAFADQPLVLTGASDQYSLQAGNLEILDDPQGRLGIEDVSRPPVSERFKRSARDIPNFGLSFSAHWIRFTLVNKSSANRAWTLTMRTPNVDHVDLYYGRPGGFEKKVSGRAVPWNARDIHFVGPSFRLNIPQGASLTCYLRLRNLGLIWAPLSLRAETAFWNMVITQQTLEGLFFGAAAVIALCAAFFLVTFRDGTHLSYLLFIVSTWFATAAFSGWAYQYLWPTWPRWNRLSVMLFCALAPYFQLQLARTFLISRQYAPVLDRVGRWMGFLTLLVCILVFVHLRLAVLLGPPLAILCVYLSVLISLRVYMKGAKQALGFILAFAILSAAWTMTAVTAAGVGPDWDMPRQVARLGVLVTAALLFAVIVIRTRRIEEEYAASLEEEVSDRTSDLRNALNDLQSMHEQLELRVQERTAELAQSNEQLRDEIIEREKAERRLEVAHFQLEEQARACFLSEERFRTVFEAAQDGIFIKDLDLRYTHVNPAMLKLLNEPRSSVISKADHEVFDEDYADTTRAMELRTLDGESVETELTLRWKDWPLILSTIRFPMNSRSGEVVGLCGIIRDVTERRRPVAEPDSSYEEYESPSMKETREQIHLAAETDSTVLFLGESGSGKDYWAHYLHEHSRRAGGPYFTINCAALNLDLAESELFGHEVGAFTGARTRKRGLLELAEGGTLLLNEIGDMPLPLQSKLLTFLDTRSFTRLGSEKTISVNARLIAATNRDLESDIERGDFRKDLYHRLNVFSIRVPPLRERREDLLRMAQGMLNNLAKRFGLEHFPTLDPETRVTLTHYDWPGNVRELQNVLERAVILSRGATITMKEIPIRSEGSEPTESVHQSSHVVRLAPGDSYGEQIESAKRFLVTEALRQTEGNVTAAARLLAISRGSMKHHIQRLGIARE